MIKFKLIFETEFLKFRSSAEYNLGINKESLTKEPGEFGQGRPLNIIYEQDRLTKTLLSSSKINKFKAEKMRFLKMFFTTGLPVHF